MQDGTNDVKLLVTCNGSDLIKVHVKNSKYLFFNSQYNIVPFLKYNSHYKI